MPIDRKAPSPVARRELGAANIALVNFLPDMKFPFRLPSWSAAEEDVSLGGSL